MDEEGAAPVPNGWSGLHAMAMLHGLNRRCFAMLADLARTEALAVERSAVYRELGLWKLVNERACERAARCPVLLFNLNFDCLDWWKRVHAGDDASPDSSMSSALLDELQARSLLREILMEIWRLGRSPASTANLLFGLATGVGAEISSLSGQDLDRIVVHYASRLRPRWERNSVFWRNLLNAAIGTDDEALFGVHLHCLQLLGSDLEPR